MCESRGLLLGLLTMKPVQLLCLLFIAMVCAHAIQVDYTVKDNIIYKDEIASFVFTVTNNDSKIADYIFYSIDSDWSAYSEPTTIKLSPKKSANVTVFLDPNSDVDDSELYTVDIFVQDTATKKQKITPVSVTIYSDRFREIVPNLLVKPTVGDSNKVDPTKPVVVELYIQNLNSLAIDSAQLLVQSQLFSQQLPLTLKPNQAISDSFIIGLSGQTPPQEADINIKLVYKGKTYDLGRNGFEISSVSPGFERQVVSADKSFLKQVSVIRLSNIGNVKSTEQIKLESNLLQRFFIQSSVGTDFIKEGGSYYTLVSITLDPGAQIELTLTENYRPFFITVVILLSALLIGAIVYFVFRSAILIKKQVVVLKRDKEGISDFKVVIHIKNRTSKLVENIRVLERAPNIIEVSKEFAVGTLKPSKILHSQAKGTLLRWDFETLEPYEERVVTYTVKAKLLIIGDQVKLLPTVVKYESFGHTRQVSEHSFWHKASDSSDEE
jgi:hypothetical protein